MADGVVQALPAAVRQLRAAGIPEQEAVDSATVAAPRRSGSATETALARGSACGRGSEARALPDGATADCAGTRRGVMPASCSLAARRGGLCHSGVEVFEGAYGTVCAHQPLSTSARYLVCMAFPDSVSEIAERYGLIVSGLNGVSAPTHVQAARGPSGRVRSAVTKMELSHCELQGDGVKEARRHGDGELEGEAFDVVRPLDEAQRQLQLGLEARAQAESAMLESATWRLRRQQSGRTPLHDAAERGDASACGELLADPRWDANARDIHGCIALHYAAEAPPGRLLRALRENSEAGVRAALAEDPHAAKEPFMDHGFEPPLCAAVRLGCRAGVVRLLAAAGADARARDTRGRSPLELLSSGAAPQAMFGPPLDEVPPLAGLGDWAQWVRDHEEGVAAALLEVGAEPSGSGEGRATGCRSAMQLARSEGKEHLIALFCDSSRGAPPGRVSGLPAPAT
ncbi:unnamed protein product [Prorocentrum cordatum]|uniref:ANK_REP_REGION domain-containing protein n=1 Tax=Prorocentrum cordatum TaxID=2364126 RepID=A0ABN9TC10_9DINO|nr:unnamed protein product [Polarella glacialis]